MRNNFLIAGLFGMAVCSSVAALDSTPVTPESILPDHVNTTISINPYTGESGEARKGTVAATLNNVAKLNLLLSQKEQQEQEVIAIANAIEQLIPSLQVIGLFDLFEPAYWIGEGEQPGRVLAISLYFKKNPEKCTPEIKQKLISLKGQFSSPYLLEQIDAL